MINLSIRQLRYFEALAEHHHFGHAAEAVGISQPALSVQIRELERELGTQLFERAPREVRLTRFGEEFAVRVAEILRRVDELGDVARAARERLIGRLRLGVIPTIAPYMLPAIVSTLTTSHEGLDIHLRETVTSTLIQELIDARLDAAIVALPVSEPSLTEVPLFDETFVLVRLSKDEGKPVPDRDSLREMQLLLLEEGHCFRDQALSFCNITPTMPRKFFEASSLSTLVQMVSAGIGLTLIPEMAVGVETRSADVSVARLARPEPSRRIGMIWRKSNPLAGQLLQVADEIRGCAPAPALAETGFGLARGHAN